MTTKLYDQDSHCRTFSAQVLSCTPVQGGQWHIVLDQTAFFPEGGGQPGDQGTLDTVRVLDTRERGDAIVHITDGPLTPGTSVTGELDWALRFARMQCHSGEHVLSGLAHSLYGCTNVGFHMGEDQVILDFDKELTPQQLTVLEDRANQLITENRPDTARKPTPEEQAAQEALRSHLERKDGFYTILVSGSDDGNGNSDTNILVAVDTVNGYVYGVSIPRDSKAVWDGKSHKINAAFGKGGMTKLAEVVSDQLGIPVDYTVSVDLTGFEALVEAIGGVNFDVPIDMDYDDPIQNLSIHFKKGVQYLNGADAMRVVRFRHNNDGTGYGSEDLGRMQTQQKFLKAVAKKMLTASNILTKIDDYAKIFNQYVDTDLSVGNLAWLGTEVLKMGVDKIDFSTLPNEWRSPYIYLIPDETLTLVNTYLNPYVEDRTAEDLHLPS